MSGIAGTFDVLLEENELVTVHQPGLQVPSDELVRLIITNTAPQPHPGAEDKNEHVITLWEYDRNKNLSIGNCRPGRFIVITFRANASIALGCAMGLMTTRAGRIKGTYTVL